ncbi:MAG: MoaD/ThiS family protein [Planctomycetota bacterium JB042]
MPRVTVRLPPLLRELDARLPDEHDVEAATVRGALDALIERHPTVGPLLLDERGAVRRHVLCVWNDRQLRPDALDRPVEDGDVVRVMQAVSGG